MARPVKDRIGEVFGRLTIKRQWRDGGETWAEADCSCGKEHTARLSSIVSGTSRSCGCLVKDTRVSPIRNRVGERFGRLTVVALGNGRTSGGGVRWICECDCGNEKEINGNSLVSGNSKSCGCLQLEPTNLTHGMSGSVEHKAWGSMKSRCQDVNNPRYADYGGRGIKVCERWQTFENFYADMGARPEGMSLDRLNNDRDYEPGNVAWRTAAQQHANRRPMVSNAKHRIALGRIADLEAELAALRATLETNP